ncbi:flagellar biosynthesis protein FlhB [Janthinobacterium sp. GB4P2]|uniref:flagellar biosynthesis protein FlhB n=1 Tax=Janthinobacterium sp. GB4P2 TaxID=3424189 RepID=UPI003F281A52
MAEQDADRSEQATQHKLSEARNKGSVARSSDLNAMAVMAALMMTVYGSGWDALRQTLRLQQRILAHATVLEWSADDMAAWMGQLLIAMLHILAPLFMTLAVVAVLINVAQTGPVFSFHPLAPDLNRLNPATGLKRLFSLRILYETAKSVVKLVILSAVAYHVLRDTVPGLMGLSAVAPALYAKVLLSLIGALLVKLVLALFLIAAVDLGYTRWDFAKRMRMSKRDIRDESKNREGDPRIRSRIRQLRFEMLKRSKAMQQLPGADVLITNPTRLAVALRYQHGETGAPQVVAKGAGELARSMREIAGKHHIPIVQNKLLARALFREVDYDGYVPEKLYPQIAKIMVWVYTMRESKRTNEG